jgi:hypothetical protein
VGDLGRQVDRIPWQVVALAGLVGFLVLVRYTQLRMTGRLQ